MKKIARITALGSYLPEKILSNADLEKMVDTTDEWIVTRTGIRERRIASKEESCTFMATRAAQDAGVELEDIDIIIVATMTPDTLCPSTAVRLQASLGISAPAFDIQAACSGFIYAISVAKAYVESGMAQNVLVVGVEKMTPFIDFSDRESCVLFGDGAAAAVVSSKGKGLEIENILLGADGTQAKQIEVPAGGSSLPASFETVKQKKHFLKLSGREVFKHAIRKMDETCQNLLASQKLTTDDISWVVAHQANGRILDSLARSLQIENSKFVKTLEKYGNTSASSIGIALDELLENQIVEEGGYVLLVAFGAGFTWGSALLKMRDA